jgi:hypothetical protein
LPEMIGPDLLIVLETTTPIYNGRAFGGIGLPPGVVVHVSLHAGGLLLTLEAKPLKLGGALPPLNPFSLDQVALQNVRHCLRAKPNGYRKTNPKVGGSI